MNRFTRRIIIFYIFTFIFTFILGGTQEAVGIPGFFILPQLAPGLGALVMLLVFRKEGFRFSFRGIETRRLLGALVVPGAAALITYLLYFFVFRFSQAVSPAKLPWMMLLWMPLGALGEELGWRGFLQRILREEKNFLFSSIITGLLWAAWHVGNYARGTVFFIFFVLLMICCSIVMSFLCGREGNVVIASVFHFMINFTNLFSINSISSEEFMIISCLVWAVPAAVIVLKMRSSEPN